MAVAAAVAIAVVFVPEANARSVRPAALVASAYGRAVRVLPTAPNDVLYSQQDNDSGAPVISQNFEAQYDAYDSSGADDFVIPRKHTWSISQIDVTGQYVFDPGPCRDETVTLYKNASGVPDTVIATQTAAGTDLSGSFQIPVSISITAKRRARRVWIGVVCNMDFETTQSMWGWETRTVQGGKYPAQWENPGGGFGGTCPTWKNMQYCDGNAGEGPDFMFAIEGTQS